MDLSNLIKELVFTDGSLVVPDLGKFYTVHQPARIDKAKQVLIPPAQVIRFDPDFTQDDGRLSGYLHVKYGMNDTLALEKILAFVKNIKAEMEDNGKAPIKGLGILKKGTKGFTFHAFRSREKSYTDVLPVLDMPFRSKQETAPNQKKVTADQLPSPVILPAKRKRFRVPVMILIALAILTSVIYFTGLYTNLFSELGLIEEKEEPAGTNRIVFGKAPVEPDSLQQAVSSQLDESTTKENALSYTPPTREDSSGNPEPENTSRLPGSASSGAYYIIAGSYLVPNNAERQCSQLQQKGFQATVLPPNGTYYMVSVGSYQTLEQAREALEKLRAEFGSVLWVDKR